MKTVEFELSVVRTFFLTEEWAEVTRKVIGNRCITHEVPCYELSDWSIMYWVLWWPASVDTCRQRVSMA